MYMTWRDKAGLSGTTWAELVGISYGGIRWNSQGPVGLSWWVYMGAIVECALEVFEDVAFVAECY